MRPPVPSWTINRLLTLKPGQQFIYYTGHLPRDQHDSECCWSGYPSAPQYAALLAEIQGTANQGRAAGRLKLFERRAERRMTTIRNGHWVTFVTPVTEYVAEGL